MKLRIKGSSLRLRLTQQEVQDLAERGEVEDRVLFGGDVALAYRLSRDTKIAEITVGYGNNLIDIRVPDAQALQWCRTDLVTLAHSQTAHGAELRVAVEKDFACLAPREDEDESDNFPHPQAAEGRNTC